MPQNRYNDVTFQPNDSLDSPPFKHTFSHFGEAGAVDSHPDSLTHQVQTYAKETNSTMVDIGAPRVRCGDYYKNGIMHQSQY